MSQHQTRRQWRNEPVVEYVGEADGVQTEQGAVRKKKEVLEVQKVGFSLVDEIWKCES